MNIPLTLEIYNRYKDNFSRFKQEHPKILESHPEAIGDWDSWLLKTGIKEVIKSMTINSLAYDFDEDDKRDIIVHRITFYVLETLGAEDILIDGIASAIEDSHNVRGTPLNIDRDKIEDIIIEED